MKKRLGFTIIFFVGLFVAYLSYGNSDTNAEDCGQLLVPPDRAMLGIEYELEAQGLRIKSVVSGGPAEKAGLLAGDLIVEINGDALLFRDRAGAARWLNRYSAGQALDVAVHRDGVARSMELRGQRITCKAAKRLARLLEAAEAGGLEGCSTDEAAVADVPEELSAEELSVERYLALLGKFPIEGGVLVLTVGHGGAPIAITADVPLKGEPLELSSLPDFMQELAGRLGEGESISFRVEPQAKTFAVLTSPQHLWTNPKQK